MRLTEDHGAKLIRSHRASARQYSTFVTVAQYVNECLASLPEPSRPALQQYRQRVDPLSKQWFEQGIRNRDADLLMRIVEEVFNSSYGDDSLLALGELSLEAGQYGRARRFWRAAARRDRINFDPWSSVKRINISTASDHCSFSRNCRARWTCPRVSPPTSSRTTFGDNSMISKLFNVGGISKSAGAHARGRGFNGRTSIPCGRCACATDTASETRLQATNVNRSIFVG